MNSRIPKNQMCTAATTQHAQKTKLRTSTQLIITDTKGENK